MMLNEKLLSLYERYALAGGRIAIVAQLATAHFVLVGGRRAAPETYEVKGPYGSYGEASNAAKGLVAAC